MVGSISDAPGRIFISYRRHDADFPAGWLYDRLSDHYSGGQVFKDVDSIELGDDFVAKITSAVGSCDVLLALIGDKWLTITDEDGRRRLDDPDDFVRLEIEAALERDVLVIPILVGGTRMPRAGEMSTSLAKLATRQALELSPSQFDFDLSRLLKVLDKTLARVQDEAKQEIPERRTRDDEDERTQAWLRLQIQELEERERRPTEDVLARPVEADLHPVRARTRAAARYELRVSNPNAAPARLSIRPGHSSSSLRIAVDRSRHEIEPGGTAVTAVSVRPRWPLLVRHQHEHTFSLDLATEGAPASGVQGTLVQERRVPLWSVALLLPVLAFLIVRWLGDAPLQDTILFVRGGAIWKVNPTTEEAELVAQVEANGFAPSVSPDGERIAFGREEGENDDVWVMDADGSHQVNLTPDSPESDDASPSWSPDGSKIVFHSDREDGNYDIYWMPSSVGGPLPKQLTFGGPQEKHPEWSPDGRWIAFESTQNDDSEDGPFDIYRMTPNGDKKKQLTEFLEDDGVPAWSPDSRQIVFRSQHEYDYEVWKMNADGSDEKRVTYGDGIVRAPAWSPEGGRIVFARGSGENFDLYVVDAEGGDLIPLVQSVDDNRGPTWCCFGSLSG